MVTFLHSFILWLFHTFLHKWIFFEKLKTSVEALEAANGGVLWKTVFLEISQNSQ